MVARVVQETDFWIQNVGLIYQVISLNSMLSNLSVEDEI